MIVLTVYRSRTFAGDVGSRFCDPADYSPECVASLRRQFARNLTVPHEFVCLSDDPSVPGYVPLRHQWNGWWAKMEMFRERWGERVLYCDLDNVLLGNVDELTRCDAPFIGMHDWHVPGLFNSSLMTWRGEWTWLYEEFVARPAHWAQQFASLPNLGDQAFIAHCFATRGIKPAIWRHFLPSGFFVSSNVLFQPNARLPANARFVAWAGRPKLWDFRSLERAFEAWRG